MMLFKKNETIAEHSFVFPAQTMHVKEVKDKIIEICRENDFSYKSQNFFQGNRRMFSFWDTLNAQRYTCLRL